MSLFTIFDGERSIYDVLETSRYPDEMVDGYDYNPVVGKTSIWNPLGDILSSLEKLPQYRVDGDKFYTIRLDGHAFSKRMVQLKRLNLFGQGYSLEFESIMTKIASTLLSSVQNALYAFTQSDEIVLIVSPCEVDEHGKFVNFEFQRRRDKLVSIYASMATNIFTKETMKLVMTKLRDQPDLDINLEELPEIQFDARIAQFESLAEAFQLILWRSYDCSVNGISSGIVFQNSLPSKKKLLNLHCGDKLKYLREEGLLTQMTRHQLYGSFMYLEAHMVTLPDGKQRRKRKVTTISEQLVRMVKEDTFPVPFR
jgi:tRNA(His) 5'-end guanylyltransferase